MPSPAALVIVTLAAIWGMVIFAFWHDYRHHRNIKKAIHKEISHVLTMLIRSQAAGKFVPSASKELAEKGITSRQLPAKGCSYEKELQSLFLESLSLEKGKDDEAR